MRSYVVFAFLALIGCSGGPGVEPLSATAVSEGSLRAADDLQRAAVVAGDVQAVRAMMHPQYRVNAPTNRVMTREEILSMFEGGLIAAEPVERIVEAAVVSGTTGLVMG
nr:nuclear transport factor 2 family protein [Sphingomonas sp.]